MANQLKITLRPPPHRDYLTGFPGVPACDPSVTLSVPNDPLVQLPILLRPQANLSGTVEVRPALKGTRAKWLRVELEKIEIVPAPAIQRAKNEDSKRDKAAAEAKKEVRFVELIGNGPGTLWAAPDHDAVSVKSAKKKKSEDEDGWDYIPEGNYPFKIPLPEGLPPTTMVDSKGSGIEYQLVATLCCSKSKSSYMSLLKSSSKPILTSASAPVLLLKADILPCWPAYAPLLPHPLPTGLPWAKEYETEVMGETREAKMIMRGGGGGEVWIKVTREKGAFGPGDKIDMKVTIGSGSNKPVKLMRLDGVLRETLTFRYPPPSTSATQPLKSPPRVTSIFTANASVSASPADNPEGFAVLYQHEPLSFILSGLVPGAHSRVTVRTAKHIDVVYHLKIRALLEGGEECAVDHWTTLIGAVGSREAKGLMEEIGWVEGLCDRPPAPSEQAEIVRAKTASPTSAPTPPPKGQTDSVRARTLSNPMPPTGLSSSPKLKSALRNSSFNAIDGFTPDDTDANTYANANDSLRNRAGSVGGCGLYVTHGRGLASAQSQYDDRNSSPALSQQSYRPNAKSPPPQIDVVAQSEDQPDSAPPPAPVSANNSYMSAEAEKTRLFQSARATADQEQLRISNPSDTPSPNRSTKPATPFSAEEEKERLYRQAQQTRDVVQASVTTASTSPEDEKTRLHREAEARRDYLQSSVITPRLSESSSRFSNGDDEKSRLHRAAVVSREKLQSSYVRDGSLFDHQQANAAAAPTRSNTLSTVIPSYTSAAPSPPVPVRANTAMFSAEQEKRRLFEAAKATARQRQEEARAELERQNALLAEMERDEMERLEQELAEERARAQAEEEARVAEEQARRVREEFEREQAERARVAEEKMRQRMEQEAIRREEERRREAEARRQAEQQRQAEAAKQSQLLKERMEREKEQAAAVAEIQARTQYNSHLYETPSTNGDGSLTQSTQAPHQSSMKLTDAHSTFTTSPSALLQSSLALHQSPIPPHTPPQAPFARHGAGLERAPSTASFAPGTSLSQATSAFYANAIANSSSLARNPTNAEEKSAYLRTLRARDEARRTESLSGHANSAPARSPSGYDHAYTQSSQVQQQRYHQTPHTPQRHYTAESSQSSNLQPPPPPPMQYSPQHYSSSQSFSSPENDATQARLQQSPQSYSSPQSFNPSQHELLGQHLVSDHPQDRSQSFGDSAGHSASYPNGNSSHDSYGSSGSAVQTNYQPVRQQTYDIAPPTPDQSRQPYSPVRDPYSPQAIPFGHFPTPQQHDDPHVDQSQHVQSSTNGGSSPLPATSSSAVVPSEPLPHQYKTAREEKEEEEARRRASDARQVSTPGDEDGLPNYQSETGNAPKAPPSAAEEKQQLNAYYAAKAAVEAFRVNRGPPPLPPQRQPTGSSVSVSTPMPPSQNSHYAAQPSGPPLTAIQEGSHALIGQGGTTYTNGGSYQSTPPQVLRGPRRQDSGSDGSIETQRDPAISAGKQRSTSSPPTPPLPISFGQSSTNPPHRQASGYLINDVDFGTFSIADGLGFDGAQEYLKLGNNGGEGPSSQQ